MSSTISSTSFIQAPITISLRVRPDAELSLKTVERTLQHMLFTPLFEPNRNQKRSYRILMAYSNPQIVREAGIWKNIVKPFVSTQVHMDALLWQVKAGDICYGQITDIMTTVGDYSKASVSVFDHFSAQVLIPNNASDFSQYETQSWIQFTLSSVRLQFNTDSVFLEGNIKAENGDGIVKME